MKRRPRLYFSFRSPYSWLAVHRLRQAVPDVFDRLDWYPYWDPDTRTSATLAERGAEFHYVQMSRAKHRYLLLDTKRLAEQMGLAMAWPIDVDSWWELPHLAWLWARRQGRAVQFYDALVTERWARGADICTPEVLGRAALAAGLDVAGAQAAPDDEQIREEGAGCLVTAYEDDVFGIPYLRWGRHRFWGLDRVDHFLRAWQPAAEANHTGSATDPMAGVPAGASFDTDTAGGCG